MSKKTDVTILIEIQKSIDKIRLELHKQTINLINEIKSQKAAITLFDIELIHTNIEIYLDNKTDELINEINTLIKKKNHRNEIINKIKAEFDELLALLIEKINSDLIKEENTKLENSDINVFIISPDFLDSNFTIVIFKAIEDFLKNFGYVLKAVEEPIYGSFLQLLNFIKESIKNFSPIKKGFKTLQDIANGKPQAEVEKTIIESSTALLKSIKDIDNVCLVIDKFIVIKWTENNKVNLKLLHMNNKIEKILKEQPWLIENPSDFFYLLKEEANNFKPNKLIK